MKLKPWHKRGTLKAFKPEDWYEWMQELSWAMRNFRAYDRRWYDRTMRKLERAFIATGGLNALT